MMHYTHLTKIKAHHTHPQSYMQTLNLRGRGEDDRDRLRQTETETDRQNARGKGGGGGGVRGHKRDQTRGYRKWLEGRNS